MTSILSPCPTNSSRHLVVVTSSLVLLLSLFADFAHSWSAASSSTASLSSSTTPTLMSRRGVFSATASTLATGAMAAGVLVGAPQHALAENTVVASIKDELAQSKLKLKEIPDLLQAQEWDKVRNVLKTPPVNKLWNLGDSQNSVLKLAKETGDVELFELKDELAYNLQMCDQLTYDNVFVYFQPGAGKIKIKEPTDTANKAIEYLDQIIAAAGN